MNPTPGAALAWDLDTSRLWDLIEGRRSTKKALVGRLEALGDGVRAIEAVVIDPYAGYKAPVRDLAPHATRVADRFPWRRLARTLSAWEPELRAYFDDRLTNGPMRVALSGTGWGHLDGCERRP